MMPDMTKAVAGLLVAICVTTAFADELPPEGRGMDAVARVFAAEYPVWIRPGGRIEVYLDADPPWSGARIVNPDLKDKTFYLEARGDAECHYDLDWGTPDGKGERVASIAFSLLSREIETHSRQFDPDFASSVTYDLTVFGLPGAVCDYYQPGSAGRGRGKYQCYDRLRRGGFNSDNFRRLLRNFQYVFDHVCSPTELPLGN
jgi:hypothetical protein